MMLVWLCYILAKLAMHRQGFGGSDPTLNNDWQSFFINLFMLQSMGLSDHLSWNVPSWSIGALILTYISFYIFYRLAGNLGWLKALPIALVGYGFIGLVLRRTDFDITYDYGFVRCLAGFYAGVFCYGLKQNIRLPQLSRYPMALLEVVALVAFSLALQYAEQSVIILYGSVPLLCAIVLLLSSNESGFIGRLLESDALRWIGKLAFSIYLTHFIVVFNAAKFYQYVVHGTLQPVREQYGTSVMGFVGAWTLPVNVVLIGCVLAVSYFTYRWIESPCRRWSRQWAALWEHNPPLLRAS